MIMERQMTLFLRYKDYGLLSLVGEEYALRFVRTSICVRQQTPYYL